MLQRYQKCQYKLIAVWTQFRLSSNCVLQKEVNFDSSSSAANNLAQELEDLLTIYQENLLHA